MAKRIFAMNRRLDYIVLLLLLIGMICASPSTTMTSNNQVITRQVIHQAGAVRLSDILFLVEGVDVSTISGLRWIVSFNGLNNYQQQNWLIFLDGQRMDVDFFNIQNLNMLPVTIDLIDSIEIMSVPQVYMGEFTESGLIHIHTSRPKAGLSVQTRYAIGNETGDPGPYLYTKYRSENVDRLGPAYSYHLMFDRNNNYFRTGLSLQDHYFTDPAIFARKRFQNIAQSRGQIISPSLLISSQLFGSRQDFLWGYSTSKEFFYIPQWGSDLLFLKPLSTEIPTQSSFSHLGMNGGFKITDLLRIKYRAKYSSIKIEPPEPGYSPDLSWNLKTIYSNIESEFQTRSIEGNIGLKLDHHTLESNYILTKNRLDLLSTYVNITAQPSDRMEYSSGIYLTNHDDSYAFKSYFSGRLFLCDKFKLNGTFSFSQSLFEENNSFWYWTLNGYRFLEDMGIRYKLENDVNTSKRINAEIQTTLNLREKLDSYVTIYYRNFQDVFMEKQDFNYDRIHPFFPSDIMLFTGQKGKIFGIKISTKHKISNFLQHQIFYWYQGIINGSNLAKEHWRALPRHHFRYLLIVHPVQNFSIFAAVNSFSSSYWVDYQTIKEDSDGKYLPEFQPLTTIDATVTKHFWKNRIWASIIFRNITNQNERYHPLGARFNLRWYVQAGFHLNSIWNPK